MASNTHDLIAGAWRNGVSETTLTFVNEEMERRRAGFRLLPLSSTVVDLADLLDCYDDLVEDLLLDKGKAIVMEGVAAT